MIEHITKLVNPTHMHYVATPYSRYKYGMEQAWREASRVTGELLKAGVKVFSPIAHGHALSVYADIEQTSHDFWLTYDVEFMSRMEALIVARMEGWDKSAGVSWETDWFRSRNRPVYHVDPVTLKAWIEGEIEDNEAA